MGNEVNCIFMWKKYRTITKPGAIWLSIVNWCYSTCVDTSLKHVQRIKGKDIRKNIALFITCSWSSQFGIPQK